MYYFPGDWEQFNQVKNQLKWVSDTEKAQMAELNIMHQRRISDYLEEFDRDFGVYVEIAEEAVRQGYLE